MLEQEALCPNKTGVYNQVPAHDAFGVLSCCKGPYCNKDFEMHINMLPVTASEFINYLANIFNQAKDRLVEPERNNYVFAYVAIPIIMSIILFSCLICMLKGRFRYMVAERVRKKRSDITSGNPTEANMYLLKDCSKKCSPLSISMAEIGIPCDVNSDTLMHDFVHARVGGGFLTPYEIDNVHKICEKVDLLSRGRFGNVWSGNLQLADPAVREKLLANSIALPSNDQQTLVVAVKVFAEAEFKSWEAEAKFFRIPNLCHGNILKFIGADVVTDPVTGSASYWLVSEFHEHGNLREFLVANELDVAALLRITLCVAQGLGYMHAESYSLSMEQQGAVGLRKPSMAHRDLKSRNILVKRDFSACIADFGLALCFEPGQAIGDAHFQVGTRRYMAPEVLDGAIQFSRDAFLRIDIYALGLVMWELMSRCGVDGQPVAPYRAPFEAELGADPSMEMLQHSVAVKKLRPQPNPLWADSKVMASLWETVQQCWDQDAEARLSAGCVAERLNAMSGRLARPVE